MFNPIHVNANQAAISFNIVCSFALFKGCIFENEQCNNQKCILKNTTGECVFSVIFYCVLLYV